MFESLCISLSPGGQNNMYQHGFGGSLRHLAMDGVYWRINPCLPSPHHHHQAFTTSHHGPAALKLNLRSIEYVMCGGEDLAYVQRREVALNATRRSWSLKSLTARYPKMYHSPYYLRYSRCCKHNSRHYQCEFGVSFAQSMTLN